MARLPVPAAWTRQIARVDAMPARDRGALVVMAVAALLAVEYVWVQPLLAKRALIEGAVSRQRLAALGAEQVKSRRADEEQRALDKRLALAEQSLVRQGALRAAAPVAGTGTGDGAGVGAGGAPPSPGQGVALGEWLARALAGQTVQVVGLRALDVDAMQAGTPVGHPSGTHADAQPAERSPRGARATQGSRGAGTTPTTLYRHRFELTLAGDPAALVAAVDALGERLAPLRLARARLAADDGRPVQASLTFVVLSTERTWISL